MPESDEKIIPKDLKCPNCGKTNRLAIVEDGQNLSERYQRLLLGTGYRIIKKRENIACQHCGQKFSVK